MGEHHTAAPNRELYLRVKTGLIHELYSKGQISRVQRDELLQLQRQRQ